MAEPAPPNLNRTAWWTLRDAFKRTLPKQVTDTYLAAVLSLETSAAKNVLRNLKLLGLVNQENEPTDLAARWRDDGHYADACGEIGVHAYPDDLLSAVPGPKPDARVAAQWFQRSRRLGEGAANNAARTYVLVTSAELPTDGGRAAGKAAGASEGQRGPKEAGAGRRESRKPRVANRPREVNGSAGGFEMPRPQIAVQINISPDMTPEQIDQVFASMAKHFYSEASAE